MSETKIKNSAKNLEKALKRLEEALNSKIKKDLKIDLVIKRFEFTFEMFWKFLRRILQDNAAGDVLLSRDVFKKSFEFGLIKDEKIYLEMLDDRNASAHEYNLDKIIIIYTKIKKYFQMMKKTHQLLQKKFVK